MMLSDVCLSVAYIGSKSRTERSRKTKICHIGSPRHRWLGYHFQGQKDKGQGHRGWGHIVVASRTACLSTLRMVIAANVRQSSHTTLLKTDHFTFSLFFYRSADSNQLWILFWVFSWYFLSHLQSPIVYDAIQCVYALAMPVEMAESAESDYNRGRCSRSALISIPRRFLQLETERSLFSHRTHQRMTPAFCLSAEILSDRI